MDVVNFVHHLALSHMHHKAAIQFTGMITMTFLSKLQAPSYYSNIGSLFRKVYFYHIFHIVAGMNAKNYSTECL